MSLQCRDDVERTRTTFNWNDRLDDVQKRRQNENVPDVLVTLERGALYRRFFPIGKCFQHHLSQYSINVGC